METRLERYNKNRRQNLFRFIILFIKLSILTILSFGFSYFVYRVNESIVKLDVLENTNLVMIDISNGRFSLLGKDYIINILH